MIAIKDEQATVNSRYCRDTRRLRFPSKEEAEQSVGAVVKRVPLYSTHCDKCDGWHVWRTDGIGPQPKV